MGSRYAFIVLYVLLERYMSRGDYLRPGLDPESQSTPERASGRGAVRTWSELRRDPLRGAPATSTSAAPRSSPSGPAPRDLGTGALFASAAMALAYVAIGVTSIAAARIVGPKGNAV